MTRGMAAILDVVVVATAIGLVAWLFVDIDRGSHSVSDTLRPWLLDAVAILVVSALIISLVHRLAAQRPRD